MRKSSHDGGWGFVSHVKLKLNVELIGGLGTATPPEPHAEVWENC